jgi:protein SCO1/2
LALWFLTATAIAVLAAQLVIRYLDEPGAPPTEADKERTAREVAQEVVTGEFSLIDHRGTTVTDEEFRGTWPLIFFGYTYCPDVCPTTLAVVGLVMDLLGEDAAKVQPLFITVDPARDTPEIMADYVAAFHPRIIGLTGSATQIAAAAQSHRAYYAKVLMFEGDKLIEDEYAMDHSAYLYLMDPEGVYATVFASTDMADDIAEKIRGIMNE